MLSVIAVGTIGKKLIYRKRKNFDDVKKYTKTVNPDLPGQKTQKGYFKEAINEWKTAGYSSLDVQAWNVYARSKKVTASGFNMFTGLKINAQKEGKIWRKLTNCNIYGVKGWGFKVDIDVESDLSGILYLGTSKYSMLKEFEGIFSVNKYTFTVKGLSEKTKYYFYIKNTSIGKEGRTGIYCKETGIGKVIYIDIGYPAIDREGTLYGVRTAIMKGNPANVEGTINTVEIFAYADMTEVAVATFFVVNGNRLSTRDDWYIGTVTDGTKRIFPVSLGCKVGDYIGIKWRAGSLERYTIEGEGIWHTSSGQIPCTNYLFSFNDYWIASLYGTGEV
ncbi:hypothetical protein ES705_48451 [subsurface metagenome]